MKGLKNKKRKKGFTLIELLAVIVVLAIVMVLATSTVLPMISGARKSAFATEANSVLDAAKNSVALLKLGQSEFVNKCTGETGCTFNNNNGTYCFTLQGLYNMGMLEKELTGYAGTVTVTAQANGGATYSTSMKSSTHYVTKTASSIKDSDVTEGTAPASGNGAIKTSC